MTETAGVETHDEYCSLRTTTDFQRDRIFGLAGERLSQALNKLNLTIDSTSVSDAGGNPNTTNATSMLGEVVDTASRYLRGYTESHESFIFPDNPIKGWSGDPILPHKLATTSEGEEFYLDLAKDSQKIGSCSVCSKMDETTLKASADESLSALTGYMANQSQDLHSQLESTLGDLDEARRSSFYKLARERLGRDLPNDTNLATHITQLETSASSGQQKIPYPIALAKRLTGLG